MSSSDIVVHGDLLAALRSRLDAWADWISGARDEADYLAKIQARFHGVEVQSLQYAERDEAGWEGARALLDQAGLSLEGWRTRWPASR